MNKKPGRKEDEPKSTLKNACDLQRLKIEKLMKNPEKEVVIPERSKEKKLAPAPEFIRNVMGSSAGAGSGEFHVYRHLRRKEYARQKFIQQQKEKTRLEEEYHEKIVANRQAADARTAKKRAKRQKNKEKLKAAKKRKQQNKTEQPDSNDSDEDDDEEDTRDKNPDDSDEPNPEAGEVKQTVKLDRNTDSDKSESNEQSD